MEMQRSIRTDSVRAVQVARHDTKVVVGTGLPSVTRFRRLKISACAAKLRGTLTRDGFGADPPDQIRPACPK